MNKKKIITLLTIAAMLTSSAAVFAKGADVQAPSVDTTSSVEADVTDISAPVINVNFVREEVTVKSIQNKVIEGVDAQGEEIRISVPDTAYIFEDDGERTDLKDLEKGDVLEVYINALSPAPAIMPPLYTASVISVKDDLFTNLDRYTKVEGGYVNDENTLFLNINDKTKDIKFVDENLKPVEELDGKVALVYYGASTRSIPAKTNPEKVIVLPIEISTNNNSAVTETERKASYSASRVKVEKIEKGILSGKDYENKDVSFTLTEDTVIYDENGNKTEIKSGDEVSVFVPVNGKNAAVVVKTGEKTSVDVDTYVKATVFGDLENKAFTLAIHISDETVIVDTYGEKVSKDELAGKDLVVFYGPTTFSIPGQTTPEKIIVLNNDAKEEDLYSDLDKNSKCYEAVKYLTEKGIMGGYENGEFRPGEKLTRAEISAIICRAMTKAGDIEADEDNEKSQYGDVADNHWAKNALNKLTKKGIISGKGNGKFEPESEVKYAEAVKMVVGLAKKGGDADKKGGYPEGYKKIAEENEILKNVSNYKNNDAITRADIAIMVYNAIK